MTFVSNKTRAYGSRHNYDIIDEVNGRQINNLTQWATDNGFQFSSHFDIINTNPKTNDYGVQFNGVKIDQKDENSMRNDCILSVPKSFVLDSQQIYQQWSNTEIDIGSSKLSKLELIQPALDFISKNGEGAFDQYLNHFILIVQLYQEIKLQSDSKYYTWIQSLPQTNHDFQTGVNMDDVEMECLPPFALALANHEKQKLNTFYDAFKMVPKSFFHLSSNEMQCLKQNAMNNNDDSFEDIKKDSFHWIFNIVHTRCWSYENTDPSNTENSNDRQGDNSNNSRSTPIIVPLGDMFNHREPPNVFVQDISSSEYIDFIYSNKHELEFNVNNSNNGLYLSYGMTNPHRFLIIFGFCDTSMPEIFSQLIFTNPSDEMIQLGCNDRSAMVYRSSDGGIPNSIWYCVLYTLLAQVPELQTTFFNAFMNNDKNTLKSIHQKYLLETAMTLRPHVVKNCNELNDLLLNIASIIQNIDSSGECIDEVHPRLLMIREHNKFLYDIFDKVRIRLDKIIESEVKERREKQ